MEASVAHPRNQISPVDQVVTPGLPGFSRAAAVAAVA
jgi:hypothetical protein